MRAIYIILALVFIATSDACVTYNPGKGTYTVDASGYIDRPEVRTAQENHQFRNKPKKSSAKQLRKGIHRKDRHKGHKR